MSEIKAYAFGVGHFDITKRASRKAMKFVAKRKGLYGVHPTPNGQALIFDTENNAKIARNEMEAVGIVCGRNIVECYVDEAYIKGAKK